MRPALVALATLLCFGCQTVQQYPVSPAPPPARVALAEPYLDLWVEGAGSVTPQETDQALQQARAALGAALDGRAFVGQAEADHLLVVQEQALARTQGRRSQQAAAIVGIVLVVVAVVVLIAVASRGNSNSRGSPAAAGAAGGRAAPRGAPVPGRAFRAPPRGPYGPPAPYFGWSFDIGFHVPVPVQGPPMRPPEVLPTLEGRLPARGFFADDETELVLELRDARSGETVWSRRAASSADPRDPAAVRALLDRIVGDQPWARAVAAAP